MRSTDLGTICALKNVIRQLDVQGTKYELRLFRLFDILLKCHIQSSYKFLWECHWLDPNSNPCPPRLTLVYHCLRHTWNTRLQAILKGSTWSCFRFLVRRYLLLRGQGCGISLGINYFHFISTFPHLRVSSHAVTIFFSLAS